MIDGVDHKICNICKEWFPATTEYFYKNKANGIDGLYPYCKPCNVEKSKEWGLENYEHSRKASRDWYKSDENKKRKNLRDRKWRKKNKEYKQEYQLQWQRNNSDKIKEYNEQHNIHKITNEEWKSCLEYFNYSCAYCGILQDVAKTKYKNNLHKEHVVHYGSNDLSNCVPACKSCNSSKWTHELKEWYNFNNPIYNKDRHYKINKWLQEDYTNYIKPNK